MHILDISKSDSLILNELTSEKLAKTPEFFYLIIFRIRCWNDLSGANGPKTSAPARDLGDEMARASTVRLSNRPFCPL